MDLNKDKQNENLLNEEQDLPKNSDPVVDVNLVVNEFDIDSCKYISEEDLTEKSITSLEKKVIRNSYEYKSYINYLKNELDLTQCALLPGIDIKTDPVSLEFHHYPLTLYDITLTVACQLIASSDGKAVSGFDIAEQVMKEHYENNIGLIPLTKTLHQMAHSNSITIPLDKVSGNYKNFYNKYKEFMPAEVLERYEDTMAIASGDKINESNREKLDKKILFLNIKYNEDQKKDDLDDDFEFFE